MTPRAQSLLDVFVDINIIGRLGLSLNDRWMVVVLIGLLRLGCIGTFDICIWLVGMLSCITNLCDLLWVMKKHANGEASYRFRKLQLAVIRAREVCSRCWASTNVISWVGRQRA